MSLGVCIPDLIEQGAIPAGRAKRVREWYDERVEHLSDKLGRAAAEAQATSDTLDWLRADVLHKQRTSIMQAQVQGEWLQGMRRARDEAGEATLSVRRAIDQMARIDTRAEALAARAIASLDNEVMRHRRNLLGETRNKAGLEEIGRAMAGETVDNPKAMTSANAISGAIEMMRRRFNAAGGRIGKLDGWYLPQSHDSRRIRAASFEEWRAHPAIERVRVVHPETGDEALGLIREAVLKQIHETLRTNGANAMEPGAVRAASLANRRADPRVLHFANYDDWIAYQRDFGTGDNIYSIAMGHIRGMARDIALMEAMGPNPAATLRFMQDSIRKDVELNGSQAASDNLVSSDTRLQWLYDELSGRTAIPHRRGTARLFSAIRAQQIAAKLGSAALSAVADFGTVMTTAGYNRTGIAQTLGRYVKLWNPADPDERRLAIRLGLVTDEFIGLATSAHRYTGEELSGEISRRVADAVMRVQGLARHTRNAQWAHGMQAIAALSNEAEMGKAFSALDPAHQRMMQRYDLGEAEWNAYRQTAPRTERGTQWIVPLDMVDERIGDRFMEMIRRETDHAIITGDVRVRATTNSLLPQGNRLAEMVRTGFIFKSFPITVLYLHGRRIAEMETLGGKAGYALPLILSMTALGGLAAQLKLIAAHKDPQPIDDPRFLGKAALQGGAFGLAGDLLYNAENSYGGGVLQTLVGPILGQTLPNAFDATAGSAIRAYRGDDPEFAARVWRAAKYEVPGRNLWMTRLAYERLIQERIDRLVDPKSDKRYARMMRRAQDEGTQYFWEPGAPLPDRAPDLENALPSE